ncbi:hypothetical protein K2P97_07380 [bacterium]|nr:hypothetical protein [bacterium]
MGALKNNFDQEETPSSKDKSTGYVGSVFASIIISTILSVLGVNYPIIMTILCGLLVLGGIGQVFKKDQSNQKRFQTLMITAATGFALAIAIAASKAKSVSNSPPTTTQPHIVTVPSTNTGEYEPLKAEDVDQGKLADVKKEMENKKSTSEEERNRQLQILKNQDKSFENNSLTKPEQFFNKLRMSGIGLETVEKVQNGSLPNIVRITVSNTWHSQPYQIRLNAAQGLQKLWGNLYSPETPDRGRIQLIDMNSNEVGGSKTLGGVWVSDK